jgi:hypothetical protein
MAKKKKAKPSLRPTKKLSKATTSPSKTPTLSPASGHAQGKAIPTPLQVAVYAAGLRLSQALIISGSDSSLFPSTAELLASLQRLIQAFNEFAPITPIEPEIRRRAGDVLDRCWETALQIPEHEVVNNGGFGDCHGQLEVFRQILISTLPKEPDDRQSLQAWFELGMKIVDGVWDDPYYPSMQRRREGDAYWAFNDKARVNELLEQLDVSLSRLMREPLEEELEQDLFANVPEQFCSWSDIEVGLRALVAEVEIANAAIAEGQQTWTTQNEPPTLHPIVQLPGKAQEPIVNGKDGPDIPAWNAETGKLIYKDEVVKTVKNRSQAKNVRAVLQKFQDAGWPFRIDDPLPSPLAERTNKTVASLNAGLNVSRLRFSADGSGKGFCWNPV